MKQGTKTALAVLCSALLVAGGVWVGHLTRASPGDAAPPTVTPRPTPAPTANTAAAPSSSRVVSLRIPIGAAVVIGVAVVVTGALTIAGLVRRAARRGAEEERRRIQREIHDGLQQKVLGVQAQLETLQDHPELTVDLVGRLTEAHARVVREMRAVTRGSGVPTSRLEQEIEEVAEELRVVGIPVFRTIVGEPWALTAEESHDLALIVREALTNVQKHATRRPAALVFVGYAPEQIDLEIVDTGGGFAPDREGEGTGLRGMRERVERLRGTLDVRSEPGSGTAVRVVVPR
jgi:signal transduction histidine kinase